MREIKFRGKRIDNRRMDIWLVKTNGTSRNTKEKWTIYKNREILSNSRL